MTVQILTLPFRNVNSSQIQPAVRKQCKIFLSSSQKFRH